MEANRPAKSEFTKEVQNMKKISLVVLPAIAIALEILPLGAVCIFAPSPTERVKETFSYFSPIPFGYANFVLSIITAVISLLPFVYGLSYFTFVGALITMALVTECILIKTQQK